MELLDKVLEVLSSPAVATGLIIAFELVLRVLKTSKPVSLFIAAGALAEKAALLVLKVAAVLKAFGALAQRLKSAPGALE